MTIQGTPAKKIVEHGLKMGWIKPGPPPMTDQEIYSFIKAERKRRKEEETMEIKGETIKA